MMFRAGDDGAIFYGGFYRDIGSGGYFDGKENIPNLKPELMFDIAKWLKKRGDGAATTSTWGEQTLLIFGTNFPSRDLSEVFCRF
jgi:hypothetical protein